MAASAEEYERIHGPRDRPGHVGSMAFDQQAAARLKLLAGDIARSGDAVLLLDAIRCLASDRSDDVKYAVGEIVRGWSATHPGGRT